MEGGGGCEGGDRRGRGGEDFAILEGKGGLELEMGGVIA